MDSQFILCEVELGAVASWLRSNLFGILVLVETDGRRAVRGAVHAGWAQEEVFSVVMRQY